MEIKLYGSSFNRKRVKSLYDNGYIKSGSLFMELNKRNIKKLINQEEKDYEFLDLLFQIQRSMFLTRIIEYSALGLLERYTKNMKEEDLNILIATSIDFGFYNAVGYLSTISDIKEGIIIWANNIRDIQNPMSHMTVLCFIRMIVDDLVKYDADIQGVPLYRIMFNINIIRGLSPVRYKMHTVRLLIGLLLRLGASYRIEESDMGYFEYKLSKKDFTTLLYERISQV